MKMGRVSRNKSDANKALGGMEVCGQKYKHRTAEPKWTATWHLSLHTDMPKSVNL